MQKYEPGDIVTFYFIINGDESSIKAWTDKKQLAEFWLEFHKCPKYYMKKITKSVEKMNEITNENYNDEIEIANLYVKDEKKKKNMKMITAPLTKNELTILNDELDTFIGTRIDYSYINNSIYYLKNKYQEALHNIFLMSVINMVINNKSDKYIQEINLDHLMVLFKHFPEEFGV